MRRRWRARREAKERLERILKTLNGELTVAEASAELGVSEAHFHRLRKRALAGAVEALEARPAGRPPAAGEPDDARVAELEQQLRDMALELRASQVREELAMVLPGVLQPPAEGEKKKRRPRKRRGGRWGRRKKRS